MPIAPIPPTPSRINEMMAPVLSSPATASTTRPATIATSAAMAAGLGTYWSTSGRRVDRVRQLDLRLREPAGQVAPLVADVDEDREAALDELLAGARLVGDERVILVVRGPSEELEGRLD